MKFKTEEASTTYLKLIDDLSKRSSILYKDISDLSHLDPRERFMMNMAVETFQQEGMARAITTATNVDATWVGLKGSMAIVSMKD